MDRLEEYLSGEFRADKQQIRDVEETLKAACNTLSVTFDKQNAWPYQVNEGQGTVTPTDISHSTTAMVAAALARTTGLLMPRATRARLFRWPLDIFAAEARSELVDTVKSALGLLMGQSGILDKTNQIHTTSGTFGDDDVLTLSCLFDLAQSNVVPEFQRTLRLAAKKPRDRLVGVDPTEPEKLLRHADSDTMENAFLHL